MKRGIPGTTWHEQPARFQHAVRFPEIAVNVLLMQMRENREEADEALFRRAARDSRPHWCVRSASRVVLRAHAHT